MAALAAFIFCVCAAMAQTTHTIAQGETLYRLSKKYGVTAEAICEANPGLSVSNFKAGTVISIPVVTDETRLQPAEQPKEPLPKCRVMHKVSKKETLYGIARTYGVTLQQLVDANDIKDESVKLKKGTLLCIPYVQVNKPVAQPEPTNEQLMPAVKASPKKHISMAVLLPLKVGDVRSQHMLEFYRGVLMAVDSIKHKGVSVDVHAIEAGTTAQDMRFVLTSHPELKQMDLIIGPQPVEQLSTLSEFSRENKIRLVVPFASQCESEINANPYLYAVTVQKKQLEEGLSALATDVFNDHNVVLAHVASEDADSRAVTDKLVKAFSAKGANVKTLSSSPSESEMVSAFSQSRKNLILVPGNSLKALTQFFSTLDAFALSHQEYTFSVLGFPEWQNHTTSHLNNFYTYDTHLFATSFRNPLSPATQLFEKKYTLWARRPMSPTTPRFGLMGFDVAWFFLCGLSRYGDGMENHIKDIKPQPYQHFLTFERVSTWGGFVTKRVKMIHYKPSQTIDLLERR